MDTPPTRRDFLSAAGAAALAGLAHGAERMPRKPNVLYVFSDEHRWQSMSFTDMPKLRTPHLARLAKQGVSFDRCISNYPVCSPHRAIQMVGRWPYQQRVIDNNIRLSPDQPTLGKAFQAAGYATGYIGKWHLGGNRAEPFGFDLSLIWSGTNDHWKSRYHPADGKPVQCTDYNAAAMTDQALAFVEKHRDEPFFLMVSWNPPHSRFTDAPKEFQALYPKGSLPLRKNQQEGKGDTKHGGAFGTKWATYAGYHAHVSAIDAEMGRVMKKLDDLNLADDTILVYTSDHGSLLGSHGVGGKRQPFEESIRVPFVARWPKRIPAGRRVDALFGTIDIPRTLCSLASVPVPGTFLGQDFSPWLRGEDGPRPESQFIMHISKKHASGGERHPAPIFRGVTTGRYTYAVHPDRPWCLFDNEKDPNQLTNLIDDPAHKEVRDKCRRLLAQWLEDAEDPFKLPV